MVVLGCFIIVAGQVIDMIMVIDFLAEDLLVEDL